MPCDGKYNNEKKNNKETIDFYEIKKSNAGFWQLKRQMRSSKSNARVLRLTEHQLY